MRSQKMSDVVRNLLTRAKEGDPEACTQLGVAYSTGDKITKDAEQAVYWFKQAAEKNVIEAQIELGMCYAWGYGVQKDEKQAVLWYQKAALAGSPRAQYYLGLCYDEDQGVEPKFKGIHEQNLVEAGFNKKLGAFGEKIIPQMLSSKYFIFQFLQAKTLYERDPRTTKETQAITDLNKLRQLIMRMSSFFSLQNVTHFLETVVGVRYHYFTSTARMAKDIIDSAYLELTEQTTEGVRIPKKEIFAFAEKIIAVELIKGFVKGYPVVINQHELTREIMLAIGCLLKSKQLIHLQKKIKLDHQFEALHPDLIANAKQVQSAEKKQYGTNLLSLNKARAHEWYHMAAMHEYANAQFKLGGCYEEGQGLQKDEGIALWWYEKASSENDDAKKAAERLWGKNIKPKEDKQEKNKQETVVAVPAILKSVPTSVQVEHKLNTEDKREVDPLGIPMLKSRSSQIESKHTMDKSATTKKVLLHLDAKCEQESSSILPDHTKKMVSFDEIQALVQTLQSHTEINQKLAEIEQKSLPLWQQNEIRQQTEMERQRINSSLALEVFTRRFRAKFNQYFTGCMAISSGLIDCASTGGSGFRLLGNLFFVPTAGISFLAGYFMGALFDRKKQQEISGISNEMVVGLAAAEMLVEKVARRLALRYEHQINQLTVPKEDSWYNALTLGSDPVGGAQTLAECAVARILEAMKEGMIDPNLPMEQQWIDSVFQAKAGIGIFQAFMDDSKIETILPNQNWTDRGIFRGTGIRVQQETNQPDLLYGNIKDEKDYCCQYMRYQYRLGSLEEVTRLNLTLIGKENPRLKTEKLITKTTSSNTNAKSSSHLEDRLLTLEKELEEAKKERKEHAKVFNRVQGKVDSVEKVNQALGLMEAYGLLDLPSVEDVDRGNMVQLGESKTEKKANPMVVRLLFLEETVKKLAPRSIEQDEELKKIEQEIQGLQAKVNKKK